jgi:hypothetical protein
MSTFILHNTVNICTRQNENGVSFNGYSYFPLATTKMQELESIL